MLVMEPGGYRFGDYVKVGLPMLFLTMLTTVALAKVILSPWVTKITDRACWIVVVTPGSAGAGG